MVTGDGVREYTQEHLDRKVGQGRYGGGRAARDATAPCSELLVDVCGRDGRPGNAILQEEALEPLILLFKKAVLCLRRLIIVDLGQILSVLGLPGIHILILRQQGESEIEWAMGLTMVDCGSVQWDQGG